MYVVLLLLKLYCIYRQESMSPPSLQLSEYSCYIVFESALLLLFSVCRNCLSKAVEIKRTTQGSLLRIKQICSRCNYKWEWDSQPMCGNIPAGNISLSAAILYAGALPTKALRIFSFLKCCSISTRTFFRHQRQYLWPSVSTIWNFEQQNLLTSLRQNNTKLVLSGDGRADSPGHCAKYGSYTVVEMSCNKVVHFELIQVSVKNVLSPLMC